MFLPYSADMKIEQSSHKEKSAKSMKQTKTMHAVSRGQGQSESKNLSGHGLKPSLIGPVCLITGGSRGVGKGIARELYRSGATVLITGRHRNALEKTAEEFRQDMASVAGGFQKSGQASGSEAQRSDTPDELHDADDFAQRLYTFVCDHRIDDEVESVFAHVEDTFGSVDLLVNNVWGGYEDYSGDFMAPYWKQSMERFDRMTASGFRAHYQTSILATRQMLDQREQKKNPEGYLIVNISFQDPGYFLGATGYDIAKHATHRLTENCHFELRLNQIPSGAGGIDVVSIFPGFTRTEAVLEALKNTKEPEKHPSLAESHSPEFVGRAVAALYLDPERAAKSGRGYQAAELSREYGFSDVDGRNIPLFHMPEIYRLERTN